MTVVRVPVTVLAIPDSLQWSAVTVTAVTVTVGYSDTYGNPRFITNSAYRDKKSVTVTPST